MGQLERAALQCAKRTVLNSDEESTSRADIPGTVSNWSRGVRECATLCSRHGDSMEVGNRTRR
jgi:hypothetical protein